MSANLATLPGPASTVAQIVSNAASAKESAELNASGSRAESSPFAQVFKQAMGKQSNEATAEESPQTQGDSNSLAGEEEAAADLTALMPFLEALGFTRATADKEIQSAPAEASLSDSPILPGLNLLHANAGTAISAAAQDETAAGGRPAIPGLALIADSASNGLDLAKSEAAGPIISDDSTKLATAISGADGKFELALNQNMSLTGAAATSPQGNAPAVAPSRIPVETPVGASGWNEEIGNRVVWMSNRMENRAELVLTPPQMGRVEVSLTITGDQATASFVSGNPQVREALESAMPRLREILAEAGIQLGQTQVGAENARQFGQQERHPDHPRLDSHGDPHDPTLAVPSGLAGSIGGLKIGQGLVDVFA